MFDDGHTLVAGRKYHHSQIIPVLDRKFDRLSGLYLAEYPEIPSEFEFNTRPGIWYPAEQTGYIWSILDNYSGVTPKHPASVRNF